MVSEPIGTIHVRINGQERRVPSAPARSFLDLLRDDIGLTGTKRGCSIGVCGLCTILLDGRMVSSCLLMAGMVDGHEITTIEGLAIGDDLSPVQRAFVACGGVQCGICTPGQVIAATALLEANPSPSEDEIKDWMTGNLCRCTGYYKIIESVVAARDELLTNAREAPSTPQVGESDSGARPPS